MDDCDRCAGPKPGNCEDYPKKEPPLENHIPGGCQILFNFEKNRKY